MSPYCSDCGAQVRQVDSYCWQCGNELEFVGKELGGIEGTGDEGEEFRRSDDESDDEFTAFPSGDDEDLTHSRGDQSRRETTPMYSEDEGRDDSGSAYSEDRDRGDDLADGSDPLYEDDRDGSVDSGGLGSDDDLGSGDLEGSDGWDSGDRASSLEAEEGRRTDTGGSDGFRSEQEAEPASGGLDRTGGSFGEPADDLERDIERLDETPSSTEGVDDRQQPWRKQRTPEPSNEAEGPTYVKDTSSSREVREAGSQGTNLYVAGAVLMVAGVAVAALMHDQIHGVSGYSETIAAYLPAVLAEDTVVTRLSRMGGILLAAAGVAALTYSWYRGS